MLLSISSVVSGLMYLEVLHGYVARRRHILFWYNRRETALVNLQVTLRAVLCALGVAAFLYLFIVQLRNPAGGHLQKTYIATSRTPCTDSKRGCLDLPIPNNGSYTYDKKTGWEKFFQRWNNLTLEDHSVCPCLMLTSGTRKYVMTNFPCADYVRLCNDTVQIPETWDFFANDTSCFPMPDNAAGKINTAVVDVPGFHSLKWNFTLDKTLVERAGTAFCAHTERLTMFQVHQVYAMLVPAWQWHLAVVESLRTELSRHIDLAL